MKLTKSRPILIALLLMSLTSVFCILLPTLGEEVPIEGAPEGGAPEEGAPEEEAPSEEAPTIPEEGIAVQATLNVQQGLVELRRAEEGEAYTGYTVVEETDVVGNGDAVRTGEDGIALITFLDNTEIIVFPDGELVIGDFTIDDEGAFTIKLEQLLGLTFSRINFANPRSGYELNTPYGVAAVRGTGFWTKVKIEEEITTYCVVSGEVIIADDSEMEHFVIIRAQREEGDTSEWAPSCIQVDGAGIMVAVEFDMYCGDGICDPYTDEDNSTCPADCS